MISRWAIADWWAGPNRAKGAGRILDSHYLMIVLQFGPIKNDCPGMNCPEFCFQGARFFIFA
jgi:hypothetical protein